MSAQEVEDFVSPLKVTQLREELKKRNLSSSGAKSVLAQRLQEFLVKEKEQGVGNGEPQEESVAPPEQEPAPAEAGDTSEQAAESEEKDAEEVADDSTKQGEQEEYEEVMDQIVQTEASGEAVSRAADPQPAQSEAPAQEESSAEQQEDQPPPPEQATAAEEEPPPQQEEEEGSKPEEEEQEQPPPTEMEVDVKAAPEEQQGEEVPQEVAEEEPRPQEGEGEATEEEQGKEVEPQPAEEKVEQPQKSESEEQRGGVKRYREDDRDWRHEGRDRGEGRSRDRDRDRADPMKAPDPEEPESFNDSEVSLMGDAFRPPDDDSIVVLDKFNSDLHFKISGNGLGGCGLTDGGFANLWAAARAQWGVNGGKYFYEVKVEENMAVELPDSEEHPHALRVGWSIDEAGLGLGEAEFSYGYGSTGKSVVNNHYNEYGETYGPGDIIGCFVDLESSPGSISFSKNGNLLGTAFVIEEELAGRALFPHITTKNVRASLNFSEPAWQESAVDGYASIQSASDSHKERAPRSPIVSECEVLMMVGLPASGKTTWAEKHCRQNPDKRYTVLGTNLIMEKMKVSGLNRKFNYHGRWEVLIKKATDVLNRMFLLAGKSPRNYIIDQTNVYRSAQTRKMGYFDGFQRKAVCVIPPHHELRKRTAKRNDETGKSVPEDAINAMKANFHIPKAGALFDDVIFSEIYGPAAAKIVQQYKEDALGIPSIPSSKRGRYDRGGRYGPPRSNYPPYRSSYGSPYGYSRPPFPPYGGPPPLPPMYGPPRGGYRPRPSYGGPRSYPPYGPPPPRGGYYGRY